MGKSRKSSKDAKHDILIVAERLFNLHGYDNTTLQMIANELGIAQGTLGYHFNNKYKIANALFQVYIDQLFEHVNANMPADCNRYQYHTTVSFCFWRELMKHEKTRDLFFNKAVVAIWENNLEAAENKYRDITQDFQKDYTEEEIRMVGVIEEGAQPRIYKEYISSGGAMTVDQFCYLQGYMTGLLANLDEATIKRNIQRVFEIADSIPPFKSFSID